MEWLNYHHLFYFWATAHEGGVIKASEKHLISASTISEQTRALERALGEKLFEKKGRNLNLTSTGRVVYQYAEEIFSLGQELMSAVRGLSSGPALRFRMGAADVVPKLVTLKVLEPVLEETEAVHLVCKEGKRDSLLAELSTHQLDIVLTDTPIGFDVYGKTYSQQLVTSPVSLVAESVLARKCRKDFPRSLDRMPFLLPTGNTAFRRILDEWFSALSIAPKIVAEFDDTALLKEFGASGAGIFAIPAIVESEVIAQYKVRPIGRVKGASIGFYATTKERKIEHPMVAEILKHTQTLWGKSRR